jgi:hypothetical protein
LSSWNQNTASWNPVQPDPVYNPSPLNPDFTVTETSGQAAAGSHKSVLANGYCAAQLPQFCSLGQQYCNQAPGNFGNSPEDQLRVLADLFLILLGVTPVGPASSEQTCAYYRWKCLPHKFVIPPGLIDNVIAAVAGATTIDPAVMNCVLAQLPSLSNVGTTLPPRNVINEVLAVPPFPQTLDFSDVFTVLNTQSTQTCVPQAPADGSATLSLETFTTVLSACRRNQGTPSPTPSPLT